MHRYEEEDFESASELKLHLYEECKSTPFFCMTFAAISFFLAEFTFKGPFFTGPLF